MGKGEIARYEQFLLFPQCFQRLILQTRKNQGLFGKGLKGRKHGRKGVKAGLPAFSYFPTMFLNYFSQGG